MMTEADVVWVLGVLERAGIQIWIDGGWGVDALLGEQTRPHDDFDIVLRSEDVSRFTEVMGDKGFRHLYSDGQHNWVIGDANDRRIDIHLVDLSTESKDVDGVAVYGPAGLAYEVGCLDGAGIIAGSPVRCCTADYQVRSHTGYDFDTNDVHDVLALHERFGVPLPEDYTGRTERTLPST